jgi:hypothetical protein
LMQSKLCSRQKGETVEDRALHYKQETYENAWHPSLPLDLNLCSACLNASSTL